MPQRRIGDRHRITVRNTCYLWFGEPRKSGTLEWWGVRVSQAGWADAGKPQTLGNLVLESC